MLFENREQFAVITSALAEGCDLMLFENREQYLKNDMTSLKVVI